MIHFSRSRTWAVLIKEFQHILRDRLTFAMAVGIPILQLILFGYAINTDPKNLPTVAVVADNGVMAQSVLKSMENTGYFKFVQVLSDEHQAQALISTGQVQYMVVVPANFTRDVIRGDRPSILLSVDATDPAASGNAIAAVNVALPQMLAHDVVGPLSYLSAKPAAFELIVHRRYNPEGLSRYNIVPGLVGTILTMTLVVLTSLAMTRERERGTMENLLATPVRPMEVMVGKILPYVLVGYVQLIVILLAAFLIFEVPMQGSFVLLLLMIGVFMVANLGVGFTFSTIAKNQLQAMQMAFFFFLPSILLSGFMFPFRAMPLWAQYVGEILPLTHFLRIVRGVMLKGNTWVELLPQLWPMLLFLMVAVTLAMRRYQKTLD
jgi:ABC-2 type transport system permease protein